MAGTKEIRVKIASVKNTQKITKAMEMVAASKMRRAQDRMQAARPYAEKIRNVVAHLGYANPEYKHPYLVPRAEVKRLQLVHHDPEAVDRCRVVAALQVVAADLHLLAGQATSFST